MASKCPYTAYLTRRAGTLFIQDEMKIIFAAICIGNHAFRLRRVSSYECDQTQSTLHVLVCQGLRSRVTGLPTRLNLKALRCI